MGKKIKKIVKSTSPTAKLLGKDEKAKSAPTPEAPPPAPPAAQVEAPKEDSKEDGEGDTEAARKASRARGKRGLSVARSSGTGLNI